MLSILMRSRGFITEQKLSSHDVLTKEEVLPLLNTKYIGGEIIYLDSVDSTNNYARDRAAGGCSEGLVIIADMQTAGRGRLGRNWATPKASSIAFSVVLKPEIKPFKASGITLVVGTAVCRALRYKTSMDVGIKWPNDIILNRKKLCGILTEINAGMDVVNYIITGVGINVNIKEFPEDLKDIATSLSLELGNVVSRKDILVSVLSEIEKTYEDFKVNGLNNIMDEYKSYSVTLGNFVKVTSINDIMEGEAIEITDDGLLVVKLKDGMKKKVISGDVSVRGINGYI